MSDEEEELLGLTARAKPLGYDIIDDHTWGYILVRSNKPANPATHSNVNLDDVREMLDGIEWGRKLGTAEP